MPRARAVRRLGCVRADQPLEEAGPTLVAERLKTAGKRLKRARKGDIEGVHELRVAIRKIRAATSVLGETVLADRTHGARRPLRTQEKRLARLFSALGEVRDHDVLAMRVKKLARRRQLRQKGLRALVRALDERGDRARRALRKVQRRHDPALVFARMGREVARAVAESRPKRDDHRVLVRHFAASVLVRRYETVLAYEVVLPAPIEVLHRLRVAIKKLRYAIDFFGEVLGSRATALDRPLQAAQDQLGELHDHHVARLLVASVEREDGPRRTLGELRDADDAEAERLLAAFERSWKVIAHGELGAVLASATRELLGPHASRRSTLALRRAESAR